MKALCRGLSGANISACGNLHADKTGGEGTYRANDVCEGNGPANPEAEENSHNGSKNTNGPIFPGKEGHGALEDVAGKLLHGWATGLFGNHSSREISYKQEPEKADQSRKDHQWFSSYPARLKASMAR